MFNTLVTLQLTGCQMSPAEIITAVEHSGGAVTESAEELLKNPAFTITRTFSEVELVAVSAEELGLERDATQSDIYKTAQEMGLDLCPAEIGFLLRIRLGSLLIDEPHLIAMEPINCSSDGESRIFAVQRHPHTRRRLLYATTAKTIWPKLRWVFLRRK